MIIGFFVKMIIWNPSKFDCECNKACKIDKIDIKNCSCEKYLFGELILACEDEILNTTETSLDDEKVTCKKNNCLIHTISLAILWLLVLVIVLISSYFYYKKHRSKQKRLLPYHDTNNKLKIIDINKIM